MTGRFPLGSIDLALFGAYVIAVLGIGWLASRRAGNASGEFLAAGRSLTLPVFVATLVSTWYGGILGIGEYGWRFGLSTWVVFGLPYYVFALVFAVLLAARIRRSEVLSIPDRFDEVYGRRAALAGGILTFLLVNPAPYVLMLGLILQMFLGGSLFVHLVVATLVSGVFLWSGGLRAGVMTNAFEFLLMYAGFAVIVVAAVAAYGGLSFLEVHLPPAHLTATGTQSPQTILVWFFIALWTLVDPSFHQRCAAAGSEKIARNGIFVSVAFWFLFDALTVTTGLYARALLPDLTQPALAYPALASLVLPDGLRGVFILGLVATVMSTLTSMLMLAGLAGGRDVIARWSRVSEERMVQRWVRWALVASAATSVALALLLPSVVSLWYAFGSALVPGLLLPVLGSYVPALRVSGRYALTVMIAGPSVAVGLLIAGSFRAVGGSPHYPLGLEPMIPGLAVSAAVWSMGILERRRAG